ncbi:MAG: SulP family inorganic anion transporter [Verrucomicrobiales bacterium]|nr:SulP family inorganic anion transporter [Verrucomicrobiales bacterium]
MSNSGHIFHHAAALGRQVWGAVRGVVADSRLEPFPLRRTLRGYGPRTFRADLKAGVTVALLGLPQSMAFAVIAGLPLHYGITCTAVASIVGPMLANSRHTILGPTNATAFMVFSYFAAYPNLNAVALMPLLLLMMAALMIVGAYIRIADLAQYISRTVVVAYVTGAALLTMVNQVKSLLGVTLVEMEGGGAAVTLPGTLYRLALSLGSLRWESVACAIATFGLYTLLKYLRPNWPVFALTLTLITALSASLHPLGFAPPTFADQSFGLGDLIPVFPDFASRNTLPNMSRLFGLAMALAFLAMLESTAMARTLASRSGRRVDANQDLLALGVANLSCAYLSGMAASGSLTRSALNFDSGARTGISSIISGVLCLAGALTIGGAVAEIPKATLAALVILAALSLIHRRHIRICMNATRSDAVVFLVTFIATMLVPLHVAIFTGVGVSILLYLNKASRPTLVEYAFNQEGQLAEAERGLRQHPAISIVHVEGDLFFGAADLFRTQIQLACADPNLSIIILRLKNARHLDATSVMALAELIQVVRADGRDIIISGAMKDVYRVLKNAGIVELLGRQNIFLGSPTNPNLSTRNALKRAQEILGRTDADVHIFFDPNKAR